jgi:hypothetical protein
MVVGGAVVVVDVPAVVVVVVDPPSAVAITGDAFPAVGADVTMPVAALLFGYGVQVRSRELPDTTRLKDTVGSTVRVMPPPDAVNGPTVPGVEGRTNARPVAGTGVGMGASIVIGAAATVAGVAPAASTSNVAEPSMAEFPRAAAAATMLLGSTTVD